MSNNGTILVDLDGTLAFYDEWRGVEHIGEPIAPMLARVKKWLEEGRDVQIFTARAWPLDEVPPTVVFFPMPSMTEEVRRAWQCIGFIREWCEKHVGRVLTITCKKSFRTFEIWDDRAVGVMPNKGVSREDLIAFHMHRLITAAGVKVETGLGYGAAADMGVKRITDIRQAFDDAQADVDGALDVLKGVKGCTDNDASLVRHAINSLTKALKTINRSKET
jgi:hypothetical protein